MESSSQNCILLIAIGPSEGLCNNYEHNLLKYYMKTIN